MYTASATPKVKSRELGHADDHWPQTSEARFDLHALEWTDELRTGYSYVANALEPIYIVAHQRHTGIHDSMVFAARTLSSPTNPDIENPISTYQLDLKDSVEAEIDRESVGSGHARDPLSSICIPPSVQPPKTIFQLA